ncbi:PBP1A family penicillin-binding protein [Capilliphycus salinus ALCB114379]|uniref:PBP1A family penicillin-binding protein n=1 Tax=Capilliphycus salinus TaxID=2768948 RepID=UPI0039A407BA
MTSTKPPQKPKTLLGSITQVVQTLHAKVNFSRLLLKPNARVPELWVQNADADTADVYPLLGDRYTLGRSSRSCDIVVRNPVVSQVHLCLLRYGSSGSRKFFIQDENSTNGIYLKRRRIGKLPLRNGDTITLGPPELANGVRLKYVDPPPWYSRLLWYSFLSVCGMSASATLLVLVEWQKFAVRPLPKTITGPVVVFSGDNRPLRQLSNNAHLEVQNLSDVSKYLPQAVIASEDSRFYWHLGVDPIGITRAFLTNVQGGEIREGGSTISQQLARSLFRDYVGTEDSAGRKLREAIVALKLETLYSKEKLLLTYINQVYLGLDLYGFEDAAQFYFDKSAKELTLSEAATLAGILPAPNTFNPIQNYQLAVQYRDRVISRMLELGMISEEEADRARRSRIEINPEAKELLESTIAPYFYDYVFAEIEQLLGEQLAREGNFIVETALDPQLQNLAENSLRSSLRTTGAAADFSQGGIVTLNSTTGEVVSMVGGEDYQQSQFNRATQALRQPGSTFKIFSYAAALDQGIPPGSSYSCAPLTWRGQSYRGCERSGGNVDMYRGMAVSENVTALRIAQEVGLDQVIGMARRLGVRSELKAVPGLVIGQSEVTLLEMTGAFATIANEGAFNRPHAIKRILDSSDCADINDISTCRVIYSYDRENPVRPQVLPPLVASTMTQLLQGVVRSGTGQSASVGVGEAGKTGTTDDNVDLWFIGFVPEYNLTTGVWLGNDDNSPTNGSSANAAQLWKDYMSQVLGIQ